MQTYRISDLSRLFGLSSEMIRYYEKQGVIQPQRDPENGYRIYSSFDVFNLLEASLYKAMDIRLGDIEKMKSSDYMSGFTETLKQYRQRKSDEISYNMILLEHLDVMIARNECAVHNQGNYWIAHTPASYRFRMCESKEDTYSKIMTPESVMKSLFSASVRQFVDSAVEFSDDHETWYFSLEKKYAESLGVPLEQAEYTGERNELYTVIDMGEPHTFRRKNLTHIREYLSEHHYDLSGKITGIICGRGTDNGHFHRYIELHIPVRL